MSRIASLILAAAIAASCSRGRQAPPAVSDVDSLNASVAALYDGYSKRFSTVPHITATELMALAATNLPVIVDVRTPAEQRVSVIPNAISEEAFEETKNAYVDRTVITYCTVGYRSGLYATKLREEGIDAVNLKGSILAWVLAGGELVDSSGSATTNVHVYGRQWNLLPPGYTPVLFPGK